MMIRKKMRFRVRIFCALLILPTLLWGILSLTGAAQVLDYNTGEKRNKHEIAGGTDLSNITEELEFCYDDRVPFRSLMLTVNSTLSWLTELPYTKVIEPALLNLANLFTDQTAIQNSTQTGLDGNTDSLNAGAEGTTVPVLDPYYETPKESGYYPYKELAPEVIRGRDNWIFTTESYPDYSGTIVPTDEELAATLSQMEQLDQICQSKGIEIHYVAIPNKNTVYPEYMPSVDETAYSALKQLEDYVHENSSVSFSYLDDELLGAKVYGRLYYMHDTHWNYRGALAAYTYIRNILGFSPIDLSGIEAVDKDSYTGDLITYTGLPKSSFEPEYLVEMQYKIDIPLNVIRFGDDYIDEMTAENTESDKTVVVVGDSYRHGLLPYFNRDFAHTYFLNNKLLNSDMSDILNHADIIIVECVQRNFFYGELFDASVSNIISLMH